MKITTRISLGYGMLLAILLGLASYQALAIRRMQSINRMVADIDFQNSLGCLEAMRDLDLVEEYARKSFALGDPDYLNQLGEYRRDFTEDLRDLKKRAHAGGEQSEVARLTRSWDAFNQHLDSLQPQFLAGGGALPEVLRQDFESLGAHIRSVYQENLRAMSESVESARRTGERASAVLALSTLAAIALGTLVSLLIYRSISQPLAHLTEGTRAIAEGNFSYRLDTTRRDEFSQLARDFNAMTWRLDELDRMKKDFVAHVSHELKSPLASMRETIALLLEGIPGPLNEKQRRLLELNRQSGARLTAMIGNLLDLSRVEAGVMEYELQSHDLVALARGVVEEVGVQAQECGVLLQADLPDAPLFAECDGDRIVQVLHNVIGNALKFTPAGSEVRIRLEAADEPPSGAPAPFREALAGGGREGGFVAVDVSDGGPGVPDADKERVFEKFYQSQQGKKAKGQGAGLGLAICRSIMEAHRGAIWVEDAPGGGSRFIVLLKAAK
ncbi:MAG: HAMP domain-containing protein [Acidobacteriota bacterium]|jgi:two-component system sensor histidine kinase GlrK|nr:HAMP domain-containing protein [Acidobacteriota bacterium]